MGYFSIFFRIYPYRLFLKYNIYIKFFIYGIFYKDTSKYKELCDHIDR